MHYVLQPLMRNSYHLHMESISLANMVEVMNLRFSSFLKDFFEKFAGFIYQEIFWGLFSRIWANATITGSCDSNHVWTLFISFQSRKLIRYLHGDMFIFVVRSWEKCSKWCFIQPVVLFIRTTFIFFLSYLMVVFGLRWIEPDVFWWSIQRRDRH